MRKRTEAEATALIAAPRTTKPRKPRGKPELTETTWPCDELMSKAGFRVGRLDAKVKQHGVWVSAVTEGMSDRYYWHPICKKSVFAEHKAEDGVVSPSQAQFLEDHRGSQTEAVVWFRPIECSLWLQEKGLMIRGLLEWIFPYGIHHGITA